MRCARMFALVAATAVAVPLVRSAVGQAPEAPPTSPATKEHEWLKQFLGEWESEAEGSMGPDEPPTKCKGTMSCRALGDLWIVNSSRGEAMGVAVEAQQTLGYDPKKKKYVGTWVDSMFNHMWLYEGSLDAAGKTLTLNADGPDFADPDRTVKYRDVYEFQSPDRFKIRSEMQGPDGAWITFMQGDVRRTK